MPASLEGARLIVLATPVFLALIALEFAVGLARGRNTYRLADALSSIGLGMLSQIVYLVGKGVEVAVYTAVFAHVALAPLPADSPWVWLAALVLYDFLYYWHHRAGHRVALFWAAHAVHHQSEDYNLSTALRQPSTYWLAGWLFYLPMAVLGFPPLVFATVALVDLLYQYWVHTQHIGRLGWFDRWFCAPSNHRVHHAVNPAYLDRNYGGILLVWDRLFGTWQPERDDDPCIYGTLEPLRSWDPLRANLALYAALARDCWHARRWRDKLGVWLKPASWRPADVAARFPRPVPPALHERRTWDPRVGVAREAAAAALFVLLLVATLLFLWHAHTLPASTQLVCAGMLVAGLWAVGALTTPSGAIDAASAAPTVPITPPTGEPACSTPSD